MMIVGVVVAVLIIVVLGFVMINMFAGFFENVPDGFDDPGTSLDENFGPP